MCRCAAALTSARDGSSAVSPTLSVAASVWVTETKGGIRKIYFKGIKLSCLHVITSLLSDTDGLQTRLQFGHALDFLHPGEIKSNRNSTVKHSSYFDWISALI